MMRGFILGGNPHASLLLFSRMLSLHALTPDNYTYTFVLKACSLLLLQSPAPLMEGKQVHCMIIKAGTPPDTYVHSSLIHMYANSDSLDALNSARRVFQGFFSEEKEENTPVKNAMISGYMRYGYVNEAREVFDAVRDKDSATWSAMVSGYARNGMYMEALDLFRKMTEEEACAPNPSESVLVSALSACAWLGALDQGRWIHRRIHHHQINAVLGTALLDMYAKCGSIDDSYQVFTSISDKDVVAWTAMISGFAMHGYADEALKLFDQMVGVGIRPNAASFIAVLSACTHAGRVEMGRHYFHAMTQEFGTDATVEHYGCMIDLLGRAGNLAEAEDMIASMPMEPNAIIWGALLDACRMHKDFNRAAHAFNRVIELEPGSCVDRLKPIGHVLAAEGRWEEAGRVRKVVSDGEMGTTCGSSCILVDGVVHEFVAGDNR